MAGQIKPIGVVQTADGQVVGTFELVREGRQTLQFSLPVAPNANLAEIGQVLLAKCQRIVTQEPAPAMSILESMSHAGQVWTIPDAPVPPQDEAAA